MALVPLLWHLRLEKRHLGSLTNIVLNVFQHYERGDLLLRKVLGLGQSRISLTALQNTLAAAFGNAVVNAILCWFYDGKKNAVIKVFTYAVFLFRFYSVVDNS